MPKFRDRITGKILTFDHEPSQEELDGASSGGIVIPPEREGGTGGVAPGLGGVIGGLIGGKTPLGKIGAGIGAAAGTGFGDLYDMFHGGAVPTPMDEAKRLATVGGVTSGLEMAAPPVLRALGSIKNILPRGGGVLGGGGLGWLLGHPGAGAAAGAAIEAAPKVADGIDWLGTPYKPAGPQAPGLNPSESASLTKQGYSPEMQARIATTPSTSLKAAPQADAGPGLFSRLKSMGSSALDGLGAAYDTVAGGSGPVATPEPPPSPVRMSREVPYRISEDMVPDAAHVKAPSGGNEGMIYPNLTQEPNLKYGADVSAAPQRPVKGPNLTQTHSTDPQIDWDELASRQNPRRTSTLGSSFGSAEVSTPLKGLEQAAPVEAPVSSPPIGTHDDGLQRWLETGGTPEGYAAQLARGRLQPGPTGPIGSPPGYGPNTVGAAQRPAFLPKTVDQAKGMSLPEQEAWETFKKLNPGTSDAMLDSWYTTKQLGADPNAHLDLQGKIDKLLSMLPSKP